MKIHLIDGTYELFRAYYGPPGAVDDTGREVGATRALLRSLVAFLRDEEVTHVACAFDHVVESFRNDLFEGYKTGEGMDPDLYAQFELAERATQALGIVTWPMVEFEADDAIASAAHRFGHDPRVEQVLLCSPDKDLAQCVRGTRVVLYDRMRGKLLDETAVRHKFGVGPESIPDYLALVGDSADGIPGIPRWGAKSTAAVLAHYEHLDAIPDDVAEWKVKPRGAAGLAENLKANRDDAILFRVLATLRSDAPLSESLDDLAWQGAHRQKLQAFCDELGESAVLERVTRFRD